MKIFLVFALLAVSTTITTATSQLDPRVHDQEWPQQSFPQQQPLTQQLPFPLQEPQQPLFPQNEPQQPFPLQQPQPQQQQPYPQQPLPQQQLPQQHLFPQQTPQQQFPQQTPQQQFPQQQPQFPQQQPFAPYQQPLTQQPYPQEQPLPQQQPSVEEKQQLNLCKEFLLQQCNPEKVSLLQSVIPFLRPKISQQNSCQLKRQQCCRQLAHINEPSRCPAIQSIVHAIVMQQQQQLDRGFSQPQPQQLGQGMPMQPQQQLGQGIILPQHQAQFKLVRLLVIQTLPMLCNVHIPSDCYTVTAPFGSMAAYNGGE